MTPRKLLASLIRLYQWGLSPLLGPHCRFHPSCSERMRLAVEAEGILRGLRTGLGQLLRCHPFS